MDKKKVSNWLKDQTQNSQQNVWKKQYSPIQKMDATNQNMAIQIDLPCRPFLLL